ncbi:STM4015 family protein [Kitasatospora nipponensis]|uniref:STM4015 family protein n=1 Tax=Kitasatospora nipponensis TaxID=258049 RepID=A0ABP4HF89_9ACTN
MTISEHITEFHGLPVFDLFPEDEAAAADPAALPAPDAVAWRVGLHYESKRGFTDLWQSFLDQVDTGRVRAVVIGPWFADDFEPLTEALAAVVAGAARLPELRALFIGDVTYEQCELSWLQMTDITPVFGAFPQLAELVVRGADGDSGEDEKLALTPLRHERLRALRFEAGGLPGEVVRAIASCDFPALESLELWLGVPQYGGDASVADLAPFLDGSRLPALRHLGLENSQIQDEIAAAVAGAPVVARLESLSLAMGILTDVGAGALLEGQPLTHLKALDLHHHFVGEELQQRLRERLEPSGVVLDLSGRVDPTSDWQYVANAE